MVTLTPCPGEAYVWGSIGQIGGRQCAPSHQDDLDQRLAPPATATDTGTSHGLWLRHGRPVGPRWVPGYGLKKNPIKFGDTWRIEFGDTWRIEFGDTWRAEGTKGENRDQNLSCPQNDHLSEEMSSIVFLLSLPCQVGG